MHERMNILQFMINNEIVHLLKSHDLKKVKQGEKQKGTILRLDKLKSKKKGLGKQQRS